MTDAEFIEDLRARVRNTDRHIVFSTEDAARVNAISGHSYFVQRGFKAPHMVLEIADQLERRLAKRVADKLAGDDFPF
jgi:uncharacterized membrane protein